MGKNKLYLLIHKLSQHISTLAPKGKFIYGSKDRPSSSTSPNEKCPLQDKGLKRNSPSAHTWHFQVMLGKQEHMKG